MSDGCCLDRDLSASLKEARFRKVEIDEFIISDQLKYWMVATHAKGRARKEREDGS